MSGYRRFVAYVYEYEGRKKGNGKGFVKVEVRDGICRMQFRLSGVYGQESFPCEIYGYVRDKEKQECEAVYLGTCDLAGEIIAFSLELPGENVSESGYSIDDFNGMVFLAGDVMYGTGWDENPVRLDEIRFGKVDEKEREEESDERLKEELEISEELEEPENTEKEEKLREQEKAKEEDSVEERKDEKGESKKEKELEMQENPFPPTPSILEEVGDECREEIRETGKIEEIEEIEQTQEAENKAGSEVEMPESEVPESEMEEGVEEKLEESEKPNEFEESNESEELNELEESFYCPFKDGEFEQCTKIGLLDYNQLNPRDQGLLNNNFLRYGWRRYKHALIGKDTKRNCYILGVPGTYNRQEALMAGMFGFPYFKEAKCETTEMSAQEVQGHFGYWYRSINPPDRNRGNRS